MNTMSWRCCGQHASMPAWIIVINTLRGKETMSAQRSRPLTTNAEGVAVPPLPANESQRLAALRQYDLLDTPPEQAFDRITRLTAGVLGMPISLVRLLDETRQWFKSRHGFEASWTRRDIAFCGYTILDTETLVVLDASADDRFAANPLVTGDPHVRFYAGAPLITRDGHVLGTLCVLDRTPHQEFTREQRDLLGDLADLVMIEIEARSTTLTLRREVRKHQETERRLHRSLAEKEALLREVHHRVKNNLQAIWGMLQAEACRLRHNPEARERMSLVAERLAVLGSIHEQLYTADNIAEVAIGEHLDRLCEMVQSLYPDRPLGLVVEAEPLLCDIDTALPLGLITHELVSNSVRHGFPDGRAGTVRIDLRHRADLGRALLTVHDDGVGPATAPMASGLGSILLNALAGQIGATIEVSGPPGYSTTISIPDSQFHVADRA
jgi:two-component sensor histidine kinase